MIQILKITKAKINIQSTINKSLAQAGKKFNQQDFQISIRNKWINKL